MQVLFKTFSLLALVIFNSVTQDADDTIISVLHPVFSILVILLVISLLVDAIQAYKHREKVR